MSKLIERAVAWLLQNRRGHDAGLFHKSAPFSNLPDQTIVLECNLGPSGSKIPPKYGFFQEGLFPTLQWPAQDGVVQYLLVIEDPDAPLADPVVHGLYYEIPAGKTRLTNEDFEMIGDKGAFTLSGGFKYGLNRRQTVYIAPRGLLGHGPHRYFYQLVALGEEIDRSKLSALASKEEIIRQIEGKVISWGVWQGIWERTE
ncbi:PEBP-like protein [Penicillium lagena]|uniref:PEBP-like protein n=1 Tax=Penicillium lagena TaxID=94218 RepID=UPI002540923E|nr:PEBP-like protein [Penicillium lagena]KAJ5606203.1 PEBP-like protein [Penicillium lagena]